MGALTTMVNARSQDDFEREVSEAEARLARELAHIAELASQGLDTTLAEARLGVQESELHALLVQRNIATKRSN